MVNRKEKTMILNPLEQIILVLLIFLSLGAGIIVPISWDLSYWTALTLGITIILICSISMMVLLILDFISTFIRRSKFKKENLIIFSIKRLMRDCGVKKIDKEPVIELNNYIQSLAEQVVLEAYSIMRHAGENEISLEFMEIAISLVKNDQSLNKKKNKI